MSTDKLVSVITIFHNSERFLDEAIRSVFDQSYDSWELLLVDDGSTDKSTCIAKRWASDYPSRVRYLAHPQDENRGISASRNLGVRCAQGEYVSFLDSDDTWLPMKLEEQVELIEARPKVGMVYGLAEWWYSWTGDPADSGKDFVHDLGVPHDTVINPPELLIRFLSGEAAIPGPSNILARRTEAERVGGFEESFRGMYEDQVFYSKLCLATPVYAANRCWSRYRQHADSMCAVVEEAGDAEKSRQFFFEWLSAFLEKQGVEHTELLQAVEEASWPYRHPHLHRLVNARASAVRTVKALPVEVAKRTLPAPVRRWLSARINGNGFSPPVGQVRFGSLRRLSPVSRAFGYDRGLPIDRYYVEQFLATHAPDIKGHVLEIEDDVYSRQFGSHAVTHIDVLHAVDGNEKATIVADLTCADHIPSEAFDCVILTQTLQFIYDLPAAMRTVHRILRPGGVVLATVPGISPISSWEMEHWGWYWGFTTASISCLFQDQFKEAQVDVRAYGNVLTASAFLFGLAAEELCAEELEANDADYQVIVAVRAVKSVPRSNVDE